MAPTPELIQTILAKPWFYRFHLPDGQVTDCYLPEAVQAIHTTRRALLDQVLDPLYPSLAGMTALDMACHEGYFGCHLAQKGCQVMGVDARQQHVADANLIAAGLGLSARFQARQADIYQLEAAALTPALFDIVLSFGLLYHTENPVGAIRQAYALTRQVCLIETQVAPNLSGPLDWGSYQFVKPMKGSFAIVDETEELHGPEMSVTGICLAPSLEGLIWIMQAVGFKRVEWVCPPAGAYEQHAHKKRVVVVGFK